ncbi:hypothetical protein SK854_21400 [Lentzea sp. BCCO 10_0061]|uniref:Uncharacterized protein n=1 Tax=Lentzea sokolovensis TaxID=3095429 RepID=A0ABU4UYV0_9PSEU|nr:hypothetical protein [Lentzea sp. BCCO 10_0061]MDX8144687.1 hypothetical protein [Lentzea sp. BCCO 10_0061]
MIQEMLNERAQQRYGAFVGAMDFVEELLMPLEKLINKMSEKPGKAGSWRVATPDDLKGYLRTARNDLSALREQAKRHEINLKAKEWGA